MPTGAHKSSGCNVFDTEPITAIDISTKEKCFIAVTGRKMLKIMTVERNALHEVANLCGRSRKVNLDYSMTDVQWEPAGDERFATAAGNGTILIWNVNFTKNNTQFNCGKRDITEHKRTVNRISFHPTDRDILLSGSQDGTVRCFDFRRPDAVAVLGTFKGKSQNAYVRDVKFKPPDGKFFAAATETGEIQLWDIRKPDNCIQQFLAHNGPVFSIDWHPEEPDWLGTAGRDKLIKVWDTQQKPTETHQIRAIAEVARIKWRPARKYHIASCALLVDNCVSVWDIRRPYLPHAQFTHHQNSVTGIVWHRDPNILFSCGKDSMIYQNWFMDAYRPTEHASPVALGFSSTGNITFARSNQLTAAPEPKLKQKFSPHLSASLRSLRIQPTKYEDVTPVTSTMYSFATYSLNELERFKILAKNYHFDGRPLGELCDHNSNQCSMLGLRHEAQTWKIIKVLYSYDISELKPASPTGLGKTGQSNHSPATAPLAETVTQNCQAVETSYSADDKEVQNILNKKDGAAEQRPDDSSGSDDDITENETFFADKDFVFSEEQEFQFDSQDSDAEMELEDYTLANEAFEPRQDIEDRSSFEPEQERPDTPISGIDSDITSAYNQQISFVHSALANNEELNAVLFPKWDCSDVVKDCLNYYANKGDIQMCVSILLVLGDKIRAQIDEELQTQWLMSYVDLLSRLQMWTISAEVINISNLPALTEMNQTSTTVNTICSNAKCKKALPLDKCSWNCTKCHSLTPPCCVCNMTVRGLLAWCQGCGHGGHLRHIKDWFSKYRSCPTGCGHSCEYR